MAVGRNRRNTDRSQNFRVRRWLQVGAASAGMSAALLGASLVAPLAASALADDSEPSSPAPSSSSGASTNGPGPQNLSSSASPSPGTAASSGDTTSTGGASPSATSASASESSSASGSTETVSADAKSTVSAQTNRGSVDAKGAEPAGERATVSAQSNAGSFAAADSTTSTSAHTTTPSTPGTRTASLVVTPAAEPVAATTNPRPAASPAAPTIPWVVQVTGAKDPYSDAVNSSVAGFFGAVQLLVAGAPLPEPLRAALSGTAYTVRRSLFNTAPTVTPLQLTGTSDTAVAGRVSALDADGDHIVYHVVRGPASGTLQLHSDGSFTYTPGDGFDGVATFAVLAQDLGAHVNLLNPFRGVGTSASALVNEGAIKFNFVYTTGADFWSDEARATLASSATRLTAYFLVTRPVTLDYDVTGVNSAESSSSLASAGSDLVSEDPGFWRTVVQNKLISGVDSNGTAADGSIDWNFAYGWGYGESVGAEDYDFVSTAMHEVMHSFGFVSVIDAPGKNAGGEWTLLDRFIRTSGGAKPIRSDHTWNSAYDPNLTGSNGGFYFSGANAVAAYGGLVPMFTPNPWDGGSSMSHLDDATFTGANGQMMNATTDSGLGVRVLSPIELGILKDIGYTVVIPSVAPSVAV